MTGGTLAETTTFRIASITKPIVATSVVDAAERGLLSLDDPLHRILPGLVDPDPELTVHTLLDHTSGIYDFLSSEDPASDADKVTDPDLVAEVASLAHAVAAGESAIASDRLPVALAETHDRYVAPGDGYAYSSTNDQIAAMILEEVTGRTLAELLRDRVVVPLGLERASITPPDLAAPDFRAYGVTPDGVVVDVTEDLIGFGNGGNGGAISTPEEFLP